MQTPGPDQPGARVLVADDDRVIARIVSTKLTGVGYSVTVVSDGQEVLDTLRGGEVPDLLITDRFMPRVNGVELGILAQSPHGAVARRPAAGALTAPASQPSLAGPAETTWLRPRSLAR
jgi:CheY-like chemotaxis protein